MEGVEVRVREEPSRRTRLTLLDQMSAIAADGRDLSGLTLDDILHSQKRSAAVAAAAAASAAGDVVVVVDSPPPGRTLLDIIRDEDPKTASFRSFGNRDRRAWRSFKDRLRLKRSGSGAAWTSSVHVPTSDILIPTSRSLVARRNSVGSLFADSSPTMRRSFEMSSAAAADNNEAENENSSASATSSPRRRAPGPSLRPQISRRHSTRFASVFDDSAADQPERVDGGTRRLSAVLAEERSLSAREAVAAQEAAEAVAAYEELEAPAAAAPARMSLMDLLEETDRQMGFVGARYLIGEDEDDEDEDGGGDEVIEELGSGATTEQNCCVCMVRHKGAAFIPCGHTFCRLCSRELWVSRGNCPLCNGFILEILDIF